MPFLAPALPYIGSAVGGWLGSRKSGEEKQYSDAARRQADLDAQMTQYGLDRQKMLMPGGQAAIDFYTKLLTGDPRQTTMGLISPGVQAITSQTEQGKRNLLASLGPGGARDKALAMMEQGKVRDIGNAFTQTSTQLPFMGAQGLSSLFTANQPTGGSGGLAALGDAASMGAQRGANMAGLGGALGNIFGSVLFPSQSTAKLPAPNWPKVPIGIPGVPDMGF